MERSSNTGTALDHTCGSFTSSAFCARDRNQDINYPILQQKAFHDQTAAPTPNKPIHPDRGLPPLSASPLPGKATVSCSRPPPTGSPA